MKDGGDLRQGVKTLNFVVISDQVIVLKAKSAIFGMQDLAFSGVRVVLVSMVISVSSGIRPHRTLCLRCQLPSRHQSPNLSPNLKRRSKLMLGCPF